MIALAIVCAICAHRWGMYMDTLEKTSDKIFYAVVANLMWAAAWVFAIWEAYHA